ncbi:MAG TPA: hypothetical protein VGK73_07740 [Polyangiaceae bacterium]
MTDSITASAANRGYDPYDSSSTRNQRLDAVDFTDLRHASHVEQARLVLIRARRAMGHDLCGHSVTDLLADNFPWKLEECASIAREIA